MTDLKPFLQTLRDRLTLVEVIRPHVKLVRKGREYSGLCPFHKEKSPSFKVSDEKGFYHCFGCGAHGDIFDFVMQKQNMPFMDAVGLLASLAGLEVPKRQAYAGEAPAQPQPDLSLYEIMEAACKWYQGQLALTPGAPAREYLEQRRLLPETVAGFRLGYAPERGLQDALQQQGFSKGLMEEAGLIGISQERNEPYDRFRGRLMFPIWDARGRVIAFGGRILREGEPKYLNSPETPLFTKGKILYACHKAVPSARQGKPVLVAEGYMDVIGLHQAGFDAAVGPLGTALTQEQMTLLWRMSDAPILCFDGDEAGIRAAHRAAERAIEIIKTGQTLQFCFLPKGQDPDSLLREGRVEEFSTILKHPQPMVDVLWSIFMKERVLSTPEQKASARKEITGLIAGFKDPDVRHYYQEELRNRFQAVTVMQKNQADALKYGKGDWGKHSFNPAYPPSSLMAAASRLPGGVAGRAPGVALNKNQLGYKILLATLLNHPTLIEEIADAFQLPGEEMREYGELYQEILSIIAQNPSLQAPGLQALLKEKGFAAVVEEILTAQVYFHAPFAKADAGVEEAFKGLKEVWERTVVKSQLTLEASQTATAVRDHLGTPASGAQSWERYKTLKNKMVVREDEKKGA